MKLIIAGSRTLKPSTSLLQALICEAGLACTIEEIVSGTAAGVDTSAINLTTVKNATDYLSKKLFGKLREFPADWDIHGKAAGHIRNKQMADYADALLLIWDGESRGSKNMKETMLKLGKPVYEVILKVHNIENSN